MQLKSFREEKKKDLFHFGFQYKFEFSVIYLCLYLFQKSCQGTLPVTERQLSQLAARWRLDPYFSVKKSLQSIVRQVTSVTYS